MSPTPRPWREIDPQVLGACIGVMTDIDDTLTRDGRVEAAALDALHALHAASIPVIAITGRPLGWSETMGADWPVAAIVAENGGATIVREGLDARNGEASSGPVLSGVEGPPGPTVWRRFYAQNETTRRAHAQRLAAAAARILRELPQAHLARDSAGRVTDIAIDHAEYEHLDAASIERVLAIMRAEGMQASVSSIHVNGWFGDHDKWSGACAIVHALWGRDLRDEVSRWIYVGDSTNDQIMFRRFEHAVGVANLMRFAGELEHWPRWITGGERGDGFAEVARALVAGRGS